MKVAVTGASGFVGRHVLQALRAHDVQVIDVRRHAATGPSVPDAPVRTVSWDIARADGAFDAMGRPDLLIHLAWDGLPNYQATRHIDSELPTQARFLQACMNDGLRRLAVAGTCFEYGLIEGELSEGSPTDPVTQYGIAKKRLYESVSARAAELGIALDWARFFYLYGEGQGEKSLYTQLMRALDEGRETFDMSPGDQARDFLPIEEAARLFVLVALTPGGAGAVNICSGRAVPVASLVEGWIAGRGGHLSLNRGHYPYPSFEPHAFWGNRARLDAIIAGSDPTSTGDAHDLV